MFVFNGSHMTLKRIVVAVLLAALLFSASAVPFCAENKNKDSVKIIAPEFDYDDSSLIIITREQVKTQTKAAADNLPSLNRTFLASVSDKTVDAELISECLVASVSDSVKCKMEKDFGKERNEQADDMLKVYTIRFNTDSKEELDEVAHKIAENDAVKYVLKNEFMDVPEESIPDYYDEAEKETDAIRASSSSVSSIMATNDTYFSLQYGLSITKISQTWGIVYGSPAIKVGIIDTGITPIAELNGKINNTLSHNFVSSHESTLDDNVDHGTRVASIIGAICNNSSKIAGACRSTSLVNLKVGYNSGNHGFEASTVASAVNYAKNNNIRLLNASFSISSGLSLLIAVSGYNGLIIASAANNSDSNIQYPAAYTNDCIIAVASSTSNDTLAAHSNYNYTSVDLAAPGEGIYFVKANGNVDHGYGTSYAAPFVTATAALIMHAKPNATPSQIKNYILDNVDEKAAFVGKVLSGGRLNAIKAVVQASGWLMGDMDYSGTITASDARKILRISSKLETGTNSQLSLADVDYDGTVTAADARTVLQWSAHL